MEPLTILACRVLLGRISATTAIMHLAGPSNTGCGSGGSIRVSLTVSHHIWIVRDLSRNSVRHINVGRATGVGALLVRRLTGGIIGVGRNHSLTIKGLRMHRWDSRNS
jgi:hypothetical protein